jgi:hypothetical protein
MGGDTVIVAGVAFLVMVRRGGLVFLSDGDQRHQAREMHRGGDSARDQPSDQGSPQNPRDH